MQNNYTGMPDSIGVEWKYPKTLYICRLLIPWASKKMVSNIVTAYIKGGIPAITKLNRNPRLNAKHKLEGKIKTELIRIVYGFIGSSVF